MALTRAAVEHVARLARLQLPASELERMREQLSAILDYMTMLQEVDVAGVPPTAQVTGLSSVMRLMRCSRPYRKRRRCKTRPIMLRVCFGSRLFLRMRVPDDWFCNTPS